MYTIRYSICDLNDIPEALCAPDQRQLGLTGDQRLYIRRLHLPEQNKDGYEVRHVACW